MEPGIVLQARSSSRQNLPTPVLWLFFKSFQHSNLHNSSQFITILLLLYLSCLGHLSLKPRALSSYLTDKAHQLLKNQMRQPTSMTDIGSHLRGPCRAHFAEAPLSNWRARNCNSSSIANIVKQTRVSTGVNNILNWSEFTKFNKQKCTVWFYTSIRWHKSPKRKPSVPNDAPPECRLVLSNLSILKDWNRCLLPPWTQIPQVGSRKRTQKASLRGNPHEGPWH